MKCTFHSSSKIVINVTTSSYLKLYGLLQEFIKNIIGLFIPLTRVHSNLISHHCWQFWTYDPSRPLRCEIIIDRPPIHSFFKNKNSFIRTASLKFATEKRKLRKKWRNLIKRRENKRIERTALIKRWYIMLIFCKCFH